MSEFREDLGVHKTRMNGLSCGEESMTIYSAVLIGCQRVTDGQTDGRQAYSYITCFSIADARKNEYYIRNSQSHEIYDCSYGYEYIMSVYRKKENEMPSVVVHGSIELCYRSCVVMQC